MTPQDKLKLLAKDLTKEFPRSPRELLAGYVITARAVDKCRAMLVGTAGEYHSGCPVDDMFLNFAGIAYDQFKEFGKNLCMHVAASRPRFLDRTQVDAATPVQ